ncbi:hypothetical protein DAMA08_028290 [Martiniozyma asiatica (nom. inval.)]|nr:hypothetical protein DAMA08_028290 [Martiniozyma asiatica]
MSSIRSFTLPNLTDSTNVTVAEAKRTALIMALFSITATFILWAAGNAAFIATLSLSIYALYIIIMPLNSHQATDLIEKAN